MALADPLPGSHELGEAVEEIAGIVRAGGGLRMVLNGECHQVPISSQFKTLHDIVIETDMRNAGLAELGVDAPIQGGIHGEAMVVGGDLDPSGPARAG